MNGIIDESLRALMKVKVAAKKDSPRQLLNVWIDNAFNGTLVIPRPEIERLGMKLASTTQATLADGQVADVETFTCYIEWFGKIFRTHVIANEGRIPLLGTRLLDGHRLTIDYENRFVELT